MTVHNTMTECQTNSGSVSGVLGCKERLKNTRLQFFRNAGTVVDDFSDHPVKFFVEIGFQSELAVLAFG